MYYGGNNSPVYIQRFQTEYNKIDKRPARRTHMVAVETTMWCVQLGGLNIIYPCALRINYLRW